MDDLLIDPKAPPPCSRRRPSSAAGRTTRRSGTGCAFDRTAEKKREVKRLAFFKADYTGTNRKRLEHAEAKVDELAKTYGGFCDRRDLDSRDGVGSATTTRTTCSTSPYTASTIRKG